jgi:hypothetical protein
MSLNHVWSSYYSDAVKQPALTETRESFSEFGLQFSCAAGNGIQLASMVCFILDLFRLFQLWIQLYAPLL